MTARYYTNSQNSWISFWYVDTRHIFCTPRWKLDNPYYHRAHQHNSYFRWQYNTYSYSIHNGLNFFSKFNPFSNSCIFMRQITKYLERNSCWYKESSNENTSLYYIQKIKRALSKIFSPHTVLSSQNYVCMYCTFNLLIHLCT